MTRLRSDTGPRELRRDRLRVVFAVGVVLAFTWTQPASPKLVERSVRAEAGQQPPTQPEQMPRFRAGANLVRLDAYVSQDGVPLMDLKPEDFEVLEDGVPQKVETFELIKPRGPAPEALRREPNSVRESRSMAEDQDARVFVLFMDIWHVHLDGSHRARAPITNVLNQVIGQDDMVGVMTPEMSARNLTLARRTTTIEGILSDNWYWGERGRITTPDPREREIEMCYPDFGRTQGIAREMISRRRERKTLDSIQDLIVHLEGVREERKFVIMLSEGWLFPRNDDRLARVLDPEANPPGAGRIGVGPDGRLTQGDPRNLRDLDSCDRERYRIAADDMAMDFRDTLQRANRANISFYTVDPRGLVAFDESPVARKDFDPGLDRARLQLRQTALRELAENTDGYAILNTNDTEKALKRMIADVSSYYLLGYYSTNTKLDGRFRKLTVRVKRPRVDVRARPGYLAPTEAEAASARVDRLMNGAAAGHSDTPPELRRALDRLAPARGNVPVRVSAAAAAGQIWLTTELDVATLKLPEWQQGGEAKVSMEHERGATAPYAVNVTLEPGQRSFNITRVEGEPLPPGKYVIRLALLPKGSSLPLQTTTDVVVPAADTLIASGGLVSRRGPTTGLHYRSTADARFQRTERIRLEIPRTSSEGKLSARLLGRDGQTLPIGVTLSERSEGKLQMIVADLTLAPLAQGEYVIEVALEKDGKTERAAYAFRIVP